LGQDAILTIADEACYSLSLQLCTFVNASHYNVGSSAILRASMTGPGIPLFDESQGRAPETHPFDETWRNRVDAPESGSPAFRNTDEIEIAGLALCM
jgi:hypothetical protein